MFSGLIKYQAGWMQWLHSSQSNYQLCTTLTTSAQTHGRQTHTETFPVVLISLSAGACSIIRDLRLLFSVWVSVNDGVLINSIQMHKQNTTQLILKYTVNPQLLLKTKLKINKNNIKKTQHKPPVCSEIIGNINNSVMPFTNNLRSLFICWLYYPVLLQQQQIVCKCAFAHWLIISGDTG